jgi:hypothetical protein
LKSFINFNHFDPNSSLNYERLLHAKQYTGTLHHTMKNMHRHEMQQIIIYLKKSRVLFPCENQGVTSVKFHFSVGSVRVVGSVDEGNKAVLLEFKANRLPHLIHDCEYLSFFHISNHRALGLVGQRI